MNEATVAGAQGYFRRGDGDCNGAVSAADVVNAVAPLDGGSICGNDDCDRDGSVTPADLDCAIGCLFGSCPIVPSGPIATAAESVAAPDARPLSLIRVEGTNLGDSDSILQARIGGFPAVVVDIGEENAVGVVVPREVAPGPADLVLIRDDVPGAPLSITIAPATPIGEPDSYDDTLALMNDLTERVLAIDLEGSIGENGATIRGAFAAIRDSIAAVRDAYASDPNLTDDQRAEVDAAIDASGAPDRLRATIAEVDALLAGQAGIGGGAVVDPTLAIGIAINAGRTLIAATPIVLGAPPIVIAGVIIATLATATGILVIFANNAMAPPVVPFIVLITFQPDGGGLPTVGATAQVTMRNVSSLSATRLILKKPSGARVELAPLFTTPPDRASFALPNGMDQTFCGRIDFVLQDTVPTIRSSPPVRLYVRPTIENIDPREAFIGINLFVSLRGGEGCVEDTFAVFENIDNHAMNLRAVDPGSPLSVPVPDVVLGDYRFHVTQLGFKSNEIAMTIRGFSRFDLNCGATKLFVTPGMPSKTDCRVEPVPNDARFPPTGKVNWEISNPDALAFVGTGSRGTAFGVAPGDSTLKATVSCGGTHACEGVVSFTDSNDFTVRDKTPPSIEVKTTPEAGHRVMPGGAIEVIVTARDNVAVKSVRLVATGEAVQDGSSTFFCGFLEDDCPASFTVNMKRDGFTNRDVAISAVATDTSDNTTTSDPVEFTVQGPPDTTPPVVTVLAPAEGAAFDAGATVQVSIRATDNAPNDTGVRQTLIRVEGPAVESGPDPERLCLDMPVGETMRMASFKIKNAADLARVSDRNVLIAIQAVDGAGAGCEDGNKSPVQFVRIRTGPLPMITGAPGEVDAGANITITGTNFGPTQGTSVVTLAGNVIPVVSWSDTSIVATVPSNASGQNLPVVVSVADIDSNAVTINVLGTGDVQITLVWHDSNDVDLHVIDPTGAEISYLNRSSPSGGTLDVDANAGCGSSSGAPRENVFWPVGTAPRGMYTVRVEYFEGCTNPEVPSSFDVNVKLGNRSMTLFSGSVGPASETAEKSFNFP